MFNLDYDSYTENELIEDSKIYDPRSTGNTKILYLNLTIDELDTFCQYVSNFDSEYITNASLINVKTMFDMLDRQPYRINDSMKARLEFIDLALEARLDLNLNQQNLLIKHIERNCDKNFKEIIQEEIIKELLKNRLTDYICKYINTVVYENLLEGYSLSYSKKLMTLFDKQASGKYKRLKDYSTDFKSLVSEMDNDIRRAEEFTREGNGFDLSKDNIKTNINKYLNKLKAPNNKLKTGLQYLNRMLNGGFESGRSYLFMGITGVGKSIILLSVALWIKRYNKLPPIDGMQYAVLFISQENSESETFERIFNMNVSSKDIREFTSDEIEKGLESSGILFDEEDTSTDKIGFIFKYYSDKEIGVSDIDNLISDYERKNIKIIAVIQDYIEKLQPKPNHKSNELRTTLGYIATEMSELAKARNIPFISAAQLNRTASSIVDNAIVNNKTNTIKLLGKQFLSESWDMMKNIDAAIVINRETSYQDDKEKQYLGFKLEKFRGRPGNNRIYVFIHPFDDDNGILLRPDIDLDKPISRQSMEAFDPIRQQSNTGKPTFENYDSSNNEFLNNFSDIISDDFSDDAENYVEMYKNAISFEEKIKTMIRLESDLSKKRKEEFYNYKKSINGPIIIKSKRKDKIIIKKSNIVYQ